MVKWTYQGQIYNLVIEFEDESLFAEAATGTDVDMHEGDDSAGAKEIPGDDPGRELSKGPGSVAQTSGDGRFHPPRCLRLL